MGPDRPIFLHLYTTKIDEIFTKASVSEELAPRLEVDVELQGGRGIVQCRLESEQGIVLKNEKVEVGKKCVNWDLQGLVELWWPHGHGKANRYKLIVELMGNVCTGCVVL